VLLATPPSAARAQPPAPASASVHVKDADIPISAFASREAAAALAKVLHETPPQQGTDVASIRQFNEKLDLERLKVARKLYPAEVTRDRIGGVPVQVVTPRAGISARNRERVLINLHNGGFMWGAGPGGLVESVPIAGVGRIRVITVDYRMAPEHRFPAASQDVAAVYRALLKRYRHENIGIFGCSAGGILAAEAVAWFQAHDLPRPGAIVSSCGTGAEMQGDSAWLAGPLLGQPAIPAGGQPMLLSALPYFQGVDAHDPLAYPIESRKVLAGFPPTLLLTGSRDFAFSSMTAMHRRLKAAGAPAELYVFDGLWHAFLLAAELPESQEAYGVIGSFFDAHLGTRPPSAGRPRR
jgi:acetyl esterase/lipase